VDNLALAMPGVISIRESRAADGLDRYIPIILRSGDPYDADLDRFFLELPLSGVRSPHSLRAYGYDIAVWVRFLETACGKTVWTATHADIDAFHRARRRDDAQSRVSAASWNRSIAVLDKLYSWAQSEGLVATSPFRHRHIWRQGHGTARARILARNQSYERAAKRSDLRFISLEDYRVFRDVGLRGLMADGAERPVARIAMAPVTPSSPNCSSRRACGSRRRRFCSRSRSPISRGRRRAGASPDSSFHVP